MAKGALKNAAATSGKMFTEDTVAVLMATGTVSISNNQYEMMSSLDGSRTASGFQHQFRSVLVKARELKQRMAAGETFTPVQPTKKRGAADDATPPQTPSKKFKSTPKANPKSRSKSNNKSKEASSTVDHTTEEEVPNTFFDDAVIEFETDLKEEDDFANEC